MSYRCNICRIPHFYGGRSVENLIRGVQNFLKEDFPKHQSLFESLENGQAPHTLFIGCSDSRLVPDLITQSGPGDLFVIRNVANVVPHFRHSKEYLSTTSAIEYAVQVLKVENIVVCGHSNCGGCKALFFDESDLSEIPHTAKWLELAGRAKKKGLESGLEPGNERERLVEHENIVEQIGHLLTYPYIKTRVDTGQLNILGWHFNIGTGEVHSYNLKQEKFEPIL